jgi:glutamyl-tRNA synthetase
MTVRTRFAPSPTGSMHIGGMRTALFNWLWARHCGGTFILRIDDTDRVRNMDEALGPILRAFRWLGLEWDEGPEVGGPHAPYFQSQRGALYRAAAQRLIDTGHAYRCFDGPEQIAEDRAAAERDKRPYLNVRRALDLAVAQVEDLVAQGTPHVVRLLVPRERKVAIDDVVRGHVEWDCAQMADPVLLRPDGTPLYNFATVVDDAHMAITHVIRAEEHLTNTAVQALLHEALGHELPVFAHIPYVAAPGSKEKLSKRKLDKYRKNPAFSKMFERADAVFPRIGLERDGLDPVMVAYYEAIGYLPQGVLNALLRLGWSLDDKTEFFSRREMIEAFTLERVVKNPAGLDPDKLLAFQAHWMNQLPLDDKVAGCLPFLERAALVDSPATEEQRAFVRALIEALGERLRLFSDVLDHDEFFVADDALAFDEKTFDKRVRKPDAGGLLERYKDALTAATAYDAAALEAATAAFCEREGVQLGQIVHAIRVAVTGKGVGFGLFDSLALLGRARCLARIDRALEHLRQGAK